MVEFPAQAVHTTARRWDDQRIDLTSAGTLTRDAETGGFTAAVQGRAAAFGEAWGRHLAEVAEVAAAGARGLDAAVTTWLQTDATVGQQRAFAQWKQLHP